MPRTRKIHTQCSKYWDEWLAAIYEELEALKANGVPQAEEPFNPEWVLEHVGATR